MDPWAIIDPVLAGAGAERCAVEAVVAMVRSGWSDIVPVDVMDPVVLSLFARHRIATLVPVAACPEPDRDRFKHVLRSILVEQMRIEATLTEVAERFGRAGIDWRVIKGLASAYLDYPRPELRHTGDVDLAVRPSDLARACAALPPPEWRVRAPVDRSPFEYKGATVDGPRRVEIDIHDRLFVRSRLDDSVFDRSGVAFPLAGAVALQAEERLLNAAGSFIATPPGSRRISGLFDVTRILDTQEVDLDRVRRLAEHMRMGGLIGAALRIEAAVCGRDARYDFPRVGPIDRLGRLSPRRRMSVDYLMRLRHVPPRDVPGYLALWVRPTAKDRERLWQHLRSRVEELRGA